MKVNSRVFKGIEYIQLTDLPDAQQVALLKTINHDLFIKIMIEKKIVSQCLQYKDYSVWYESLYKSAAFAPTPKPANLPVIANH